MYIVLSTGTCPLTCLATNYIIVSFAERWLRPENYERSGHVGRSLVRPLYSGSVQLRTGCQLAFTCCRRPEAGFRGHSVVIAPRWEMGEGIRFCCAMKPAVPTTSSVHVAQTATVGRDWS